MLLDDAEDPELSLFVATGYTAQIIGSWVSVCATFIQFLLLEVECYCFISKWRVHQWRCEASFLQNSQRRPIFEGLVHRTVNFEFI